MKPRINLFAQCSAAFALALTLGSQLEAADLDWVGDNDAVFTNGLNWEGDAFPNAATDILRFKNNSAPTTVTNVSISLSNSGTSPGTNLGQILFEATAPAFTLGSSSDTISLPSGTHNNAILLSSNSTVTQTIGSNIVIGNGAAATTSVVNSGGAVGNLLKFTGNITGDTGAVTAGAIAFSFGNTSSHNGNYEVTGNITKGTTATGISITKRGSGILTLSGNNSVTSMGQNETGSTIVIAGGKTEILQSGNQQHWGGNVVDHKVKVTGGELYANDASALRNRVEVDGGTLTIGSATTAGGMYWGVGLTAPGEVFTLKSGTVNFAASLTSGYLRGFRLQANAANQTISGTQSGGQFTVIGGASAGNVFTVGINTADYNAITSYTLSGGVLDLKGQNGTSQGHLQINADAAGLSTTTFTLSGTGKLISRFSPSSAGGIAGGANTGAKQIFALQGGTLVAGRIEATNLRGSLADSNGTIVNNGTNIAPGDIGSSGKTTISGNFTQSSGTLSFDLGGTTASTAWQDAASSGKFDQLAVTGNASLAGNLRVNLIDGFAPTNGNSFAVVTTAASGLSGTFSGTNITAGRVVANDGISSFSITYNSADVTLGGYVANEWQGGGAWGTGAAAPWTAMDANGAAYIAKFANAPTVGTQAVDLDSARTVRGLLFDSTTRAYTLGTSNSSSLTLDNTANNTAATITDSSAGVGNHAVNVGITLNSNLAVSVDNAANTLTIGGDVSGSGKSLTKTGNGKLTLSGSNNTYSGPTTVSAGTLYVTGALASSNVVVQANGTVGSDGVAGNLGNGLSINAGGNLDLSGATLGANSTGILNLTGGTLTLGELTFQDLVGWDWANAAVGTYELIDGTFTINWGSTAYLSKATAYDFGNGKKGYFESGSLNVVIIPEPRAALLGGLSLLALLRRRRR